MHNVTQRITPCLWFDHQAEQAVDFYTSIFDNSKIETVTRYGQEGSQASGQPAGTVMTIAFELDGQAFLALNGGPHFKFNEAISLIVSCEDQRKLDYYWERLSSGGDEKAQQCGWLKDKYGVSWQIVPAIIAKMISDRDGNKSRRVMKAIMQMKKLDIATMQRAYDGRDDA